jgi:NAD(P)H-flavin reductase
MVPLMAMLRHCAAHPDAQITAHVLVSNRSATAGIYTTELETLTPRKPLHVAWTYTRQAPDGWRGWARRVDDAMLRAAGAADDAAKAATRVFVCGPTPFVGTVTRLLVDQGYDPPRSAPRTSAPRAEGTVGVNRGCPIRANDQQPALVERCDQPALTARARGAPTTAAAPPNHEN